MEDKKTEKVILQQEIEITYKTEEGRQLAIERLIKDTNWSTVYENWSDKNPLEFGLSKTKNITITLKTVE